MHNCKQFRVNAVDKFCGMWITSEGVFQSVMCLKAPKEVIHSQKKMPSLLFWEGWHLLFYVVHDPFGQFVDGFLDKTVGFIESGDLLDVGKDCGMVFSEGFSDFLIGKGENLS